MNHHHSGGFTFIESTIAVSLLAIVFLAILPVSGLVEETFSVNERVTELDRRAGIAHRAVERLLLPASVASLEVHDGSSWIAPVDGTPYGRVRFRILTGYPFGLTPNTSPVRTIEFVLDPSETANGLDDDGDGLDTPDDARRLVRLLDGIQAKVNLLPLNEAEGIPFTRPSDERVNRFAAILAERGVTVSVRKSRGRDIRAACGQLLVETPGVRRGAAETTSEVKDL
jgi:hypothetical protein